MTIDGSEIITAKEDYKDNKKPSLRLKGA